MSHETACDGTVIRPETGAQVVRREGAKPCLIFMEEGQYGSTNQMTTTFVNITYSKA